MEKRFGRIIIADDHAVVRTGLQLILDGTSDLSIVDEARNGQELLDKLHENEYDLVILDISMPGKDAMDVLIEVKTLFGVVSRLRQSDSRFQIYTPLFEMFRRAS